MEIKFTSTLLHKIRSVLRFIMRSFVFLLCTTVFSFSSGNVISQNANVYIESNKTVTVDEVFNVIDQQTDYSFIYKADLFKNSPKIHLKKGKVGVSQLLRQIMMSGNFNVILTENNTILIKDIKTIQQIRVSGRVTDENGMPIPGVTVLIKGTTHGTATDSDGNYSITVSDPLNILVFSSLGLKKQEVTVKDRQLINVQLLSDVSSLSEVVLVGYGKVERSELTGSVGTVDIKNITDQSPTISIDNALQGQVSGVYVSSATGQPGAASRIRIRGTTSLFGSNQPLYVIDGIPVTTDNNIPIGGAEGSRLGDELAKEGLSTPIGNISSADIESISILKDASAAAIYGSRAANGVIIINTKQGVYDGKPTFDVNLSTSVQTPKTLDVLNAEQYKQVWTTAVNNSTATDTFSNQVRDGSYFGTANTNWEDEINPGAPVSTFFNIGVYGGSQKTRYSSSLGVNTQDGVYKNSGFDRYTYNLNMETHINEIWEIGTKMNISSAEQQASARGLTQLIYDFRPDLPVFDEDGNYAYSTQFNSENPVARSQAQNNNKTLLLLGSFYLQLKLAKGLKLKTMFSLNYNNGNQFSFFPRYTSTGGWSRITGMGNGYAQESRSRSTNTVWDNTLNYTAALGKNHHINAIGGISFEKKKSSWVKAWGEGFFNDVLTNISNATVSNSGSSYEDNSGLASYFGRVNYDYKNKYLLTLSGRVDGSSKFASENQYAFFPAAALAWKLNEEAFLRENDKIDELKLRVSLGKTGQQDFGAYAWRTLYEAYDYGPEPAIILSQLGNDNLKWETTNQFDLGVDFSFFDARLRGTLGYYTKNTIDALFHVKLPTSTGYTSAIANIGDTQNTGIELELKGDIVRSDNFNWTFGLNVSKNDNKLTRINDDFKGDDGYITGFSGGGYLKEGSPIGLLFGYVADGLFQEQSEIDELNASSSTGYYQDADTSLGDIKFVDISGPDGIPDGIITSLDQKAIGDTQPDFYGGFNNTFSYKGLSLSAYFTFSVGNDMYAFGRARATNFYSTFFGENKEVDVLDAWTPENTNTSIPRAVYKDPNNNTRISSHYAYDASYLRLKTVNLSYTFSNESMQKMRFLSSVSIFISGQNLLTFTGYPGADPEASNLYNNDISAGRDNNRFPVAKILTVGVKVGF